MKMNYTKGHIPTKYELRVGELAYNVPDKIQYTKLKDDTILAVGGSGLNSRGTTGIIFDFGGNTPPTGSLRCDGTIRKIIDYPNLHEAIKDAGWNAHPRNADGTIMVGGVPSGYFALPLFYHSHLDNHGFVAIDKGDGNSGDWYDESNKSHGHSTGNPSANHTHGQTARSSAYSVINSPSIWENSGHPHLSLRNADDPYGISTGTVSGWHTHTVNADGGTHNVVNSMGVTKCIWY